ncbi:G-protein alpha subunit [Auriscalpium vulgare]|uniref:G-protein alpha subunit n=1 Tax=Auriscalpium vulgare TaxID=40419 RepID=A0ACB8S240_9AGAM|nr:G-protein alpha subunit [Auriscalpium vulgare]
MPGIVDDAEARRVSKAIDQELQRERELIRKRQTLRKDVKVMLLGQAESGKSTLQKQFQLYYASQTLDKERPSWRPIVYFNVIKAVRTILEELDWHLSNTGGEDGLDDDDDFLDPDWQQDIADIGSRLLPFTSIEDSLASELSGGVTVTGNRSGVFVRAGWQALVTPTRSWPLSDIRASVSSTRPGAVTNLAARLVSEVQYEITSLWQHPATRALLRSRKLRLDESASFFLEEIHRLAEIDYLPTTDDILHVRLQTLGVTEHTFEIDFGTAHYNWLLYDVGGARGQRHAWVPYFDDATAVIFLAPISAYDQYLEEDPRTNRIDDSLQLFTSVCTNKLLRNSTLVLMLNKTDLLKKKLQAGVLVKKYITSYGERPNRYEEVAEYFRAHFAQVHKRKGLSKQQLYTHFTSMLDIRATQKIIVDVNEAIIRSYLGQSGLA